jgi:hypothetical protein
MTCQLKVTVNNDYRLKGLMPVKITVGFVFRKEEMHQPISFL